MSRQFSTEAQWLLEDLRRDLAEYIRWHYVESTEPDMIEQYDSCFYDEGMPAVSYRAYSSSAFSGAPARPPADIDMDELAEMVKNVEEGFSTKLLQLIDATGKKDSDVYTRAMVSRQHFSKIRKDKNYRPTKKTAIAFALALELDVAATEDLIRRAGYALSNSSVFDLIIRRCIERRQYNLPLINCMLEEYGQPQFGI